MVHAGTFRDLWLGDYWLVGGWKYVIAGFNYYQGWSRITANHMVILQVPANASTNAKGVFNSAAVSNMNTSQAFQYAHGTGTTMFKNVFGIEPLQIWQDTVTAYDTKGYPSQSQSIAFKAALLTPGMLGAQAPVVVKSDVTQLNATMSSVAPLPLISADPKTRFAWGDFWMNHTSGPNSIGMYSGYYDSLRFVSPSVATTSYVLYATISG